MPFAALRRLLGAALTAALMAGAAPAARADAALVAVAANFRAALEALAPDFEARTGHSLTLVSGATGKLYAQIRNGAPFDVLLAADQERPELLEAQGLAVPGGRFTYALGRLALWSPTPGAPERRLRAGAFRRLAIANPDIAPYGRAAREALARMGLAEEFAPRIVTGQSVGQVFAMVASGAAELGFVALSQTRGAGGATWEVPPDLHAPVRQDAVLLARAADDAAARAFLAWLRSDRVRERIVALGYGRP